MILPLTWNIIIKTIIIILGDDDDLDYVVQLCNDVVLGDAAHLEHHLADVGVERVHQEVKVAREEDEVLLGVDDRTLGALVDFGLSGDRDIIGHPASLLDDNHPATCINLRALGLKRVGERHFRHPHFGGHVQWQRVQIIELFQVVKSKMDN